MVHCFRVKLRVIRREGGADLLKFINTYKLWVIAQLYPGHHKNVWCTKISMLTILYYLNLVTVPYTESTYGYVFWVNDRTLSGTKTKELHPTVYILYTYLIHTVNHYIIIICLNYQHYILPLIYKWYYKSLVPFFFKKILS